MPLIMFFMLSDIRLLFYMLFVASPFGNIFFNSMFSVLLIPEPIRLIFFSILKLLFT